MVHSKVMVVDDVLLRVGSANLNNRSIGLDTECDLAVEATTPDEHRVVEGMRNRLLGHHCGVSAAKLRPCCAHRLADQDRLRAERQWSIPCNRWMTPVSSRHRCRPWRTSPTRNGRLHYRPFGSLRRATAAGSASRPPGQAHRYRSSVPALILAWRFTPLSAFAHPDLVRQWLLDIAEIPGAPLIVLVIRSGWSGRVSGDVTDCGDRGRVRAGLGFALAGTGAIASAM